MNELYLELQEVIKKDIYRFKNLTGKRIEITITTVDMRYKRPSKILKVNVGETCLADQLNFTRILHFERKFSPDIETAIKIVHEQFFPKGKVRFHL